MTQHDREATRRIVTDADTAEMRYPGSTRQTWPEDDAILALLDTREELKEALVSFVGVFNQRFKPTGIEDDFHRLEDLLARLRGEA
jgi:hypothetical protein